MKLSEQVATIVHAFSDEGRKNDIRELAKKIQKLEEAAQESVNNGHHDTCAYMLNHEYVCSCGCSDLKRALEQ